MVRRLLTALIDAVFGSTSRDTPSRVEHRPERDGVPSPGAATYDWFCPRVHEIDGELRAYLGDAVSAGTVLEIQRWVSWKRDAWSGDYIFGFGYRHALLVDVEGLDESQQTTRCRAIAERLRAGDHAQWREADAARREQRPLQLS